MRKFTCFSCQGEFETDWTEEESIAELEKRWPGFSPEECSPLCDPCDRQFQEWYEEHKDELKRLHN